MYDLGPGGIVEPGGSLCGAYERRSMQSRGDRMNISGERCFICCGLPAVVFQGSNVKARGLYQLLTDFDAPPSELQMQLHLYVRQTGTGHIVVQIDLDLVVDLSRIETKGRGILC